MYFLATDLRAIKNQRFNDIPLHNTKPQKYMPMQVVLLIQYHMISKSCSRSLKFYHIRLQCVSATTNVALYFYSRLHESFVMGTAMVRKRRSIDSKLYTALCVLCIVMLISQERSGEVIYCVLLWGSKQSVLS